MINNLIDSNFFLNIYEYPQNKDINDYFLIMIFGKEKDNFNFINGFINFLLDNKYETKYRFMLKEEKKDLIQKYYIQNNKGNFKFICINSDFKNIFSEKEFEQILNILNEEKINIFIVNRMKFGKKRYSDFSLGGIKIYNKNDLFFVTPNIIEYNLKFDKIEKTKNIFEKEVLDNIDNRVFSKFINLGIFFEIRNTYLDAYYYMLSMDGYKSFYETLIKRRKEYLEFDYVKIYLYDYITDKKEEENKRKISLLKSEKKREQQEKIYEIETKIKKEEKIITNINKCIEDFNSLEKKIKQNEYFLIPITSTYNERIKYVSSKTNVCHNCKFNCQYDCHHLLKTSCKNFDWSFNCKNCPNKCKAKYHELVEYTYPKYEYKTLDNILESYNINKNISIDLKMEKVIDKMKDKIKEVENRISKMRNEINDIKKEEIKIKPDKKIDKKPEYLKDCLGKKENIVWYNLILKFIFEEHLKPDEEMKMNCSII